VGVYAFIFLTPSSSDVKDICVIVVHIVVEIYSVWSRFGQVNTFFRENLDIVTFMPSMLRCLFFSITIKHTYEVEQDFKH